MIIPGKVRGHPVNENPDALLVQIIHKVLKVFRCTKTTCRCIITRYLVSPRSIIRMLGNWHKLDMRESHIFDIGCQSNCQFTIGHETILFKSTLDMTIGDMPPGTKMYFIDRDGRIQLLMLPALLDPGIISPGMLMYIGYDTRSARTQLGSKTVRVRFINSIVIETRVKRVLV